MRKIFIDSSDKKNDEQKVPYIDNISLSIPEDVEEYEKIKDNVVYTSSYGSYSYLKVENNIKSFYFLIIEEDSGDEYGKEIFIYVSEDKEYVLEYAISWYENEHNRPDSRNKCSKCKKQGSTYCEKRMLKSLKKYEFANFYEKNCNMHLYKYRL